MKFSLFVTSLFVPVLMGASGEEVIFDPENPSSETSQIIEDPENTSGDTIIDPENSSAQLVAQIVPKPTYPTNTSLLLRWASRSQIDTDFAEKEDIFEHHLDLNLALDAELSPSLRVLMEAEFRHWIGAPEHSDYRASHDARLGEAYVAYRQGAWAFRAGNLITRWGATDMTRPADVINPTDQTTLNPSALPRIAQPTLEASVGADTWRMTGILVPFFVPNRAWAFGRDTAAWSGSSPLGAAFPVGGLLETLFDPSVQDDVQPALLATRVPDETPQNFSGGFRASTTLANTDLAMSWFYGWDRTPSVQIAPEFRSVLNTLVTDQIFLTDFDFFGVIGRNPGLLNEFTSLTDSLQAGESVFDISHDRLFTLAVDATRYVGPIGVRAEAVFQPERTFVRHDLSTERKKTLSGALGLSWEHINAEDDLFAVSVEGFLVEPLDGGEYVQVGRGMVGAAALVNWVLPSPSLQLQLAGTWVATAQDVILAPSINWRAASVFNVRLFGLFFGSWGDEKLTTAKIMDHNDFVGVEFHGAL